MFSLPSTYFLISYFLGHGWWKILIHLSLSFPVSLEPFSPFSNVGSVFFAYIFFIPCLVVVLQKVPTSSTDYLLLNKTVVVPFTPSESMSPNTHATVIEHVCVRMPEQLWNSVALKHKSQGTGAADSGDVHKSKMEYCAIYLD